MSCFLIVSDPFRLSTALDCLWVFILSRNTLRNHEKTEGRCMYIEGAHTNNSPYIILVISAVSSVKFYYLQMAEIMGKHKSYF